MIVSSTRAVLWSWLIPHSEGQTPDLFAGISATGHALRYGRPYDQRLPLVPSHQGEYAATGGATGQSMASIARATGIPRTTLRRRLSGEGQPILVDAVVAIANHLPTPITPIWNFFPPRSAR